MVFSPEIKKNFGFGCMRIKNEDNVVDLDEFSKMVDLFMESGFNYFDTAHGYLNGNSETAVRECLAKRYDRSRFVLTDKLSDGFFEKEEDIKPLFSAQLEACGVEYFDFYLFHAVNGRNYEKYKATNAFGVAQELKKDGKIKHVGMSFHDNARVLDKILSEQPTIEVVQLQFNYLDYDSPVVESRECYEVCKKHGKPVIVMEPVRGGKLVRLPDEAKEVFDALGGTYAGYAIRYCASFDNVFMVLSGMETVDMVAENVNVMKDFQPLSAEENEAVDKVRAILKKQNEIPCTACRYCTDGCPAEIPIPDIIACYNSKTAHQNWDGKWFYNDRTDGKGKASDCIQCGQCEYICPQHLNIREVLENAAQVFDND